MDTAPKEMFVKLDTVSIKEGKLVREKLNLVLDIPKLINTSTNKFTTLQIKSIVWANLESVNGEWNLSDYYLERYG